MKKKGFKFGLLITAALLITQLFYGSVSVKADTTVIDNYITLNKTATNTKDQTGTDISAVGGENIAVNYTVGSGDIPSSNINGNTKKKKIVLVVDTSGSMATRDMTGGYSRAYTVESAANKFIEKTAGSNIDIAVVPYSDYAGSYNNSSIGFTNNKSQLESYVSNMYINGGTNIGDGLRKAYYMLNGIDGTTYDKYVILLTDGQPNEWTVNSRYDKSYYTGSSDAPYILGADNYDSTGDGLKYADKIGDMIAATDINTYMIAFTGDTNLNKMNEMAQHAKAQLSSTRDSDGLNSIYDSISNQIKNSFTITGVNFREEFPSDVTIVHAPAGFTIDNTNHVVTGQLANLTYTLSGTVYKLSNPLSFKIDIKFKDTSTGKYALSSVSKLYYTDYNSHTNNKDYNKVNVTLTAAKPKITTAPIDFTRSMTQDKYSLVNGTTDDIDIKHSIVPEDIDFYSVEPDDYFKNKYVVVVTDTSGSMKETLSNGKTKLQTMEDTLLSTDQGFLSSINGDSSVNVSLISYSDTAIMGNEINTDTSDDIKDSSGNSVDFANMNNTAQVSELQNQIKSLQANGGTNIGDGLRRAYWLLSKVDSSAKKYVVLMTDGLPTVFSYQNIQYTYSDYYKNGYLKNGNSTAYFSSISNPDFFFDDGQANKIAVNYGDSDYGGYALTYSDQTALKLAADKSISSFIIGFSDGINSSKLTEISKNANASYNEAKSGADLKSVYDAIAGQIVNDLPVSNGTFKTTIPAGLTVKSIMKGGTEFSKDKYTITQNSTGDSVITFKLDDMGGIHYKLDSTKKYFKADPINFDIILTGNQTGKYTLSKNDTYLTYTDIGLQTTTKYADKDLSFEVYQSRVREHGLYTNSYNTIDDSNFTFSTGGQPISAAKGNKYTAGVVADITGPNSPLTINIGAGKDKYNSSDINVKVIKIESDGVSYSDSDVVSSSGTKVVINADGSATITVNFPDNGTYLVTYTFKMNTDAGGSITNTAAIGSSRQDLILKTVSDIPDLF